MKFSIYQDSRIGGRKYNQDRIGHVYSKDALLMIVADGMGGHLHGEVAAQITVKLFAEMFQQQAKTIIHRPFIFLTDAIGRSHEAILDYANKHQLLETPRTTCVACLIQEDIAYWAHVGDSRLYLFRQGSVIAQTQDHSRVQQLINQGKITAQEAQNHPERNKIYNCLGGLLQPQVDLSNPTSLSKGDAILLCSDGFWGALPDQAMNHALNHYTVMHAIPQLMDQAEARGGPQRDNLSVVGVTWLNEDDTTILGHATSTLKMNDEDFTTQLNEFDANNALRDNREITDKDIEQAIAEIQEAIKRYSK